MKKKRSLHVRKIFFLLLFSGKATHSVTSEAEKQVAGRAEAPGATSRKLKQYIYRSPRRTSLPPLCFLSVAAGKSRRLAGGGGAN